MIVAVTGASGHIGANLVRALRREQRQVRALVFENERGIENLGIEMVSRGISATLPPLPGSSPGLM